MKDKRKPVRPPPSPAVQAARLALRIRNELNAGGSLPPRGEEYKTAEREWRQREELALRLLRRHGEVTPATCFAFLAHEGLTREQADAALAGLVERGKVLISGNRFRGLVVRAGGVAARPRDGDE
jgi:hypothetical protein